MDRAFSVLTTKAFTEDAEFVYIEGIASTPSPDRVEDVVEPQGAIFETPMPLLLQHDHSQPVGHMTFASPSAKGIPFKARLPVIKEPGRLKDRVDEAIHSLKYKLISAVSIGFKPISGQAERLKSGGIRFKEWKWFELSLVTVPANHEAIITAVKSIDQENRRPAAGQKAGFSGVALEYPGDSGKDLATRGAVKLIKKD